MVCLRNICINTLHIGDNDDDVDDDDDDDDNNNNNNNNNNNVWNVRTKIVPVIIEALGTIKRCLDQNRQLLPRHRSAIELQKITLMSTTHSNRRVLREIAWISCWDLDLLEDRHLSTNRRE